MIAVTGCSPRARQRAYRNRFVPMESASLNELEVPSPFDPLLNTPSQSNTTPRALSSRAASSCAEVRNTPPSAENLASTSVTEVTASSASLGAEQAQFHDVLNIQDTGRPIAVHDHDAVDLKLLQQLDGLVEQTLLADRHGALRESDLLERLVENLAAVLLKAPAQV